MTLRMLQNILKRCRRIRTHANLSESHDALVSTAIDLCYARAHISLASWCARAHCARSSAQLAYFLTAVKKNPASQHGVFSLLLRKFQNEEKTDFSSFSNFFLHFPCFFSFFTVTFLVIYAEKPTKLKKAICSFIFLFFPMLKFFLAVRKYFKNWFTRE